MPLSPPIVLGKPPLGADAVHSRSHTTLSAWARTVRSMNAQVVTQPPFHRSERGNTPVPSVHVRRLAQLDTDAIRGGLRL